MSKTKCPASLQPPSGLCISLQHVGTNTWPISMGSPSRKSKCPSKQVSIKPDFKILRFVTISQFFTHRKRASDERNVNGHRGDLNPKKEEEPKEPARIHPRPGSRPSIRPNAMKNRGKQLEALKQMEERIQRLQVSI